MHIFDIMYSESALARSAAIGRAKQEGRNPFRPVIFYTTATFPIVPRPGDRVYINLPAEYASYFQNQIGEDRPICINGKVKFVELVDNSETMCVHVIDPYSE